MTVEEQLTGLCADAVRRVADLPELDAVIEDSGRQRLAAYYLYSALLAGLIGPDELTPGRWPPELAEPLRQRGLARFAPRTGRALDAELTPAEQATRRSPGRQLEFAQILVDLIDGGSFGPLCLAADSVRLARRATGSARTLAAGADQGRPGRRHLPGQGATGNWSRSIWRALRSATRPRRQAAREWPGQRSPGG